MLPTDAQRVANHNYSPAHSPGYPNPHPPPPNHQQQQQQHRGDRGMAFGQLRQAVSSRLCDLLDEAGINATRVVSGRRFIRWDTVPKLLAQQNAYISGLPYEFFFAKAVTSATTTPMTTSSTSTFSATGGTNAFGIIPTPHAGYTLPPSQNGDEEDVSIHPFDGMQDNSAGFGSLPPLRFPSGAPAYHSHPHSSIQVDEGFNRREGDALDSNHVTGNADAEIAQTLIAQLHAQPLNINILSWKKQTIENILDGLEKQRIRVLARPQGRDVIFELELPATVTGEANSGAVKMVDIPRWPEIYPHSSHSYSQAQTGPGAGVAFPAQSSSGNTYPLGNNGPTPGGPIRNSRSDRKLRRRLSTNTNASNATGSAGSDATTSSWSGGSDAQRQRQSIHSRGADGTSGYEVYGDEESRSADLALDGVKREQPVDERMYDVKGHGHRRNGSGSASTMAIATEGPTVVPLVHNHTLTPSPFRAHYQDYSQSSAKQRRAQAQNDGQFGTLQSQAGQSSQPLLAGVQHVSRPIISASTSNHVGTFLTTPTPTKKWTRRSSPDRIFMNVTLNGILRNAGMPIPRQKDDASRLPWSSIPQFLAENGLYIRGWPEANLPWLYSGDMGAKATGMAAANLTSGANGSGQGQGSTAGIGDWRDRIDWKSSPSQRSYKPLAQALRSGDIQILPRPQGRDVLFEVRDAQGRRYDSTLGLSDEWKERYMHDSAIASGSPPAPLASSSSGGELKFINLSSPGNERGGQRKAGGHGSNFQARGPVLDEDDPEEEEEKERGRPGYHSSSTPYSRSGSSLAHNTAVESELPSPTETTASTSSGATKRQGHLPFSKGYHSARNTHPGAAQDVPPRAGYQNLVYPSGPSPLAYPYPGKAASFPPNQFHDIVGQSRRSTPPITSHDRDGAPSASRFPQLLSRQYSESTVRFQRPNLPPAEVPNSTSCRDTPSPDSSQRQRTVSLGTSSASTGTGTVLSGSSSGVPILVHPSRGGRYNLPSLSRGSMDIDMDLDNPNLNRLPPLIHLKPDGEVQKEDECRPLVFPSISPLLQKRGAPAPAAASSGKFSPPLGSTSSSSLPTHLPSPLVAFSQPTWSATERGWKLTVLDPARASLPPVGDTILWDIERRSWKLTWAPDPESSTERRSPAALWSTDQDAWILDP